MTKFQVKKKYLRIIRLIFFVSLNFLNAFIIDSRQETSQKLLFITRSHSKVTKDQTQRNERI